MSVPPDTESISAGAKMNFYKLRASNKKKAFFICVSIATVFSSQNAHAAKQDIFGIKIGMDRDQIIKLIESKEGACTKEQVTTKTVYCFFTENFGKDVNSLQLSFDNNRLYSMHYYFLIHMPADQVVKKYIQYYGLTNLHKIPSYAVPVYDAYDGIFASVSAYENHGSFTMTDANKRPR